MPDTKITALKLYCRKLESEITKLTNSRRKLLSYYKKLEIKRMEKRLKHKKAQRELFLLTKGVTICQPKTDSAKRVFRRQTKKMTMKQMLNSAKDMQTDEKRKLLEALKHLQSEDERRKAHAAKQYKYNRHHSLERQAKY